MTKARTNIKSQPCDTTPEPAFDQRPAEFAEVADLAAGALAERLKALIGDESVSSFARKCGLAESVMRTYLRDGRMPALDKAVAIAAAAGVTVDWFATGRGPRVAAEVRSAYTVRSADGVDDLASAVAKVDATVLEGILKAVLQAQGAHASAEQLAALVVDLYQRALDRERP